MNGSFSTYKQLSLQLHKDRFLFPCSSTSICMIFLSPFKLLISVITQMTYPCDQNLDSVIRARQHLSRGVLPRFDAPEQMYREMTGSEYV